MPVGYGIEYWAIMAEEYVELANRPGMKSPNLEMARRHGMDNKSMGTLVSRLRERGLITPFTTHRDLPRLTQKAIDILREMGSDKTLEPPVKFTVEIVAGSKVRALAQLWGIVQQLEHWDDRHGKPFVFHPEKLKELYDE